MRCVVDDIVYAKTPGHDAMPDPPSSVDVDLPVAVIAELQRDPDDDYAVTTAMACLTFTVGFLGFSYCTIISFGKVTLR
jgi:hypothetical protein